MDFQSLLEKSLQNIETDRETANGFLVEMAEIIKDKNKHIECGSTIAKYLETLQRSNEQLVKLTALVKQKDKTEDEEITDKDKEDMFEAIERQQPHVKKG